MFWIGQVLGIIALIVLIISFQINNKSKLLKLQTVSSFFFALQYIFLHAYSGALMNFIVLLRNYLFQKNISKKILILILGLIVISSFLTFNGVISILPIIASIEYTIALSKPNLKIIRIAEIISCLFYLIYNIYVLAYTGIISTIAEFVFSFIAILRFDYKKVKR